MNNLKFMTYEEILISNGGRSVLNTVRIVLKSSLFTLIYII